MHFIGRYALGLLVWLFACVAHADGFSASFTPQAPPPSAPQRACNGCGCDGGNTPNFRGASVADPVWTKDGSLHLSYTDLTIGSVMPINITRRYDSQSQFDSNLGYGWAFTFDQRLFQYPDGAIAIRSGCGRRDKFVFSGGAYVTPQGGSQGQLTAKGDGTFEFRYRDGNSDIYDAMGRLIARVSRNGAKQEFTYDSRGKLPLVGTSPHAVDPGAPMVVAYQPRVIKIEERGADGVLTGYFADIEYSDSTGRITKITTSDGRELTYTHDTAGTGTKGNLVGVSGLSDYSQTFAYADANDAHNLTTITDGTGAQAVVNTYDTQDRVKTQTEGGSQFSFAYPALGVTDITETVRNASGTLIQTRVSRREYNAQDYLVKEVDPLGNEARYQYDANNQLKRTELWENTAGTLTLLKAIDSTYSSTGQPLTEQVTLDSGEKVTTTWTYDQGWVQSEQTASSASTQTFRTEYTFVRDASNIPRAIASVKQRKDDGTFVTTTYTYCSAVEAAAADSTCPDISLVKSIDGPRTDVSDITQFSYYGAASVSGCGQSTGDCHHRGDLRSVTNALSQSALMLKYDASGKPVKVQNANGVVSEMTYHPRGWLSQLAIRGDDEASTADDTITAYQMDGRGNLTQVTTPDGNTVTMIYDARDRLTTVRDQANNELRFSLDSVGNRLSESAYDPNNSQKRVQASAFDKLDRLIELTGSTTAQKTKISYDAGGRAVKVVDPNLVELIQTYDDLDRVTTAVSDAVVGGINATTQYRYDAVGNLREVIDPKGLSTTYAYDALSRLTSQSSPDTGATTYTYDEAGNRITQTDARGITTTYSYDALNRVTSAVYPIASENNQYVYDTVNPICEAGETFAVGRLTRLVDQSGTTDYCYDRLGNVVRKVQTTAGHAFVLRYAYTLGGQLQAMTYPDGTQVDYVRDTQSRIQEIGAAIAGGARQVLLGSATYVPAGPASGWTYGNGRVMVRTFDKDYRASTIKDAGAGGLDLGFRYDNAGQLTQLTNAALSSTPTARYGYDTLGRLLTHQDSASAPLETYTYDPTGNRTSAALGTAAAQIYAYPTSSHRLEAVGAVARGYDPAGNRISVGGTAREFVYNNAGRMASIKYSGVVKATYNYNALGEQVQRTAGTDAVFVYDETGRLVGQYTAAGAPIQQYVWMDDQPVGVISSDTLLYVEPDHLGTPRAVIDPVQQKAVWTWDLASEAFGATLPNVDPDADGTSFVYDLRFPGQRYDSITGLHYNYYRDYAAGSGRYVQSDPIGLAGGISTYSYVGADPLSVVDVYGLFGWRDAAGFVPVLGSGLDAYDAYKCGNYGMMAVNIGLAALDLTGAGAIVKGLTVGTMKFASRRAIRQIYWESTNWNQMRRRLQDIGEIPRNTRATPQRDWMTTDHIFNKQRDGLGHMRTNAPWNLQINVKKSLNSSFEYMSTLERAVYLPNWMKLGATGGASSVAGMAVSSGSGCGCN